LILLTIKKKRNIYNEKESKQHRKKKEDEMADSIQLLFTAAKTKGSEWERVSDV
jgi:hypothetical protein